MPLADAVSQQTHEAEGLTGETDNGTDEANAGLSLNLMKSNSF